MMGKWGGKERGRRLREGRRIGGERNEKATKRNENGKSGRGRQGRAMGLERRTEVQSKSQRERKEMTRKEKRGVKKRWYVFSSFS